MSEILDGTPTRAERLEAQCKLAMAGIRPATWEHRAQRREDLEYLDILLDEWLSETR